MELLIYQNDRNKINGVESNDRIDFAKMKSFSCNKVIFCYMASTFKKKKILPKYMIIMLQIRLNHNSGPKSTPDSNGCNDLSSITKGSPKCLRCDWDSCRLRKFYSKYYRPLLVLHAPNRIMYGIVNSRLDSVVA